MLQCYRDYLFAIIDWFFVVVIANLLQNYLWQRDKSAFLIQNIGSPMEF